MMNLELPDFSKANILVIGDVMLDRYWFGEAARISPEAPVPVVSIKQNDERPGGAGNVALNIAALGANVHLLGVVGDDAEADILRSLLSASNVQASLQTTAHFSTITKLRVISRHQQLIRLDFEDKLHTDPNQALLESFKNSLENIDLVVLSDYSKGTLQYPQQFIQLAKEAKIPVLVDPKGSDFRIYSGADIITPNAKEFTTIVGEFKTEKELLDKARHFLTTHNIQSLLLTRGEMGMTLIENDSEYHLPAHAREVFDVTGAGDTVIAVLGASLAAGSALRDAMVFSNLGAGLVVGKLGAATISAPELSVALAGATSISGGIVNDEQLLLAVNEARRRGKKIVFTNGCFDILHAGHVTYLQQAKQLGDYLIVATNDDNSIARLKGPNRPINNIDQRMAVLAGLGVVDWVISYSDDTPHRLLKLLQPDILVKGGDYTKDSVVGAELVYAYGGDVRVLGLIKGVSTTSIIEKMVSSIT